MLIDFSVRNFRSIGEEITFSMIASSDEALTSNLIWDEAVLKRRNLALLKSVVVYGANASGKTSLCRALDCVRSIVRASATRLNEGDPLPEIAPFRLRQDLAGEPSRFEVRVLLDGSVYRYGFEATVTRIHAEWLFVTGPKPGSREVVLFEREGQDKSGWSFGASFRGNKAFLREQTRPTNGLILSKAAQESFAQLTPLYEWFVRRLRVFDMANPPEDLASRSIDRREEVGEIRANLASMAKVIDAGVEGIESESRFILFPEEIRKAVNASAKDESQRMPPGVEPSELYFVRRERDTGRTVRMPLEEESNGTNRYLIIAQLIVEAYRDGDTVVMDEFEASLHVLLTKDLLAAINDVDVPGGAAQFILTTHDTNLLDLGLLRRDQVFLVEKVDDQTEVFSLADIRPMPKLDAALERQYLADRFGGVPKLGNLRLAIADAIRKSTHGERSPHAEEQGASGEKDVVRRRRGDRDRAAVLH